MNDCGEDYWKLFFKEDCDVDSPSETPKLANIACNSASEGSLPEKQMRQS